MIKYKMSVKEDFVKTMNGAKAGIPVFEVMEYSNVRPDIITKAEYFAMGRDLNEAFANVLINRFGQHKSEQIMKEMIRHFKEEEY